MAIAMVAMLAFGGTYAYFSASADKVSWGDVKTATIEISNTSSPGMIVTAENGEIVPGAWIYGGENSFATRKVTSKSTAESYVFIEFSVVAFASAQNTTPIVFKSGVKDADQNDLSGKSILDFKLNPSQTITWTKIDTITDKDVYYTTVDALNTDADETEKELAFEFSVKFRNEVMSHHADGKNAVINTTADTMGVTIEVSLTASAIQTLGQGPDMKTVYENSIANIPTT